MKNGILTSFRNIFYIICIGIITSSCVQQNSQDSIPTTKTVITKDIVNINQIKTLDDLSVFNPSVLNDVKKDDSRFIELQKKQMLFGATIAQIETKKEYQDIQIKKFIIYNAQEIWTPEIKALEKRIQEFEKNQNNNPEELNVLLKQKGILMKTLRSSDIYTVYLAENQSKIDDIDNELKKYWTPELIQLEQEIKDLQSRIYGNSVH